jgi:hypothetical protein
MVRVFSLVKNGESRVRRDVDIVSSFIEYMNESLACGIGKFVAWVVSFKLII